MPTLTRWHCLALVLSPLLVLGACSSDDDADATDTEATERSSTSTTSDGSDEPSITLDRNERAVEASLACAAVETGYLGLLGGEVDSAQSQLEEGAALASQVSSDIYGRLAADLLAVIPTGDAVQLQAAADALLTQCDADGFERIG